MAIETTLHQRRAENLTAMKSCASIALAGSVVVAMICATVFYDGPLSHSSQLFSYLRSFSTPAAGG
jgi:hypothetical protein